MGLEIKKYSSILLGIGIGVLYGIVSQFMIRQESLKGLLGIMSVGFIFILPLALGAITIYFSPSNVQNSWLMRIFMPWVTSVLCLFFAIVVGWEGTICLIILSPIYLFMSSVGGVIAGLLLNTIKQTKPAFFSLGFLLLLPFGVSSIESRFPPNGERRTVLTEILVYSQPSVVWKNIIRVPKITENQDGFFYKMGFPKPVEANLSSEGIGGIRDARFERGLYFTETVTVWENEKKIGFIIQSHPESTPIKTLDTHVVPGGEYFDALYGEYEIVPVNENQIKLKLLSQYRLSTKFNFYAAIWSDFLMRDIQSNILRVIKSRCE